MIDNYLRRIDVSNLIKEIKRNPRYHDKEKLEDVYGNVGNELSLYLLYDALLKFKIVIDNDDLLEDFILQLDKLYKRIDNYNQMIVGVNKLICYMTAKLLNIRGIEEPQNRKLLIEHVYNKYILNGYYIHGFSTVYENSIKENGFISEVYINYYQQFNDVKKLFEKYGLNDIFEKDFSINKTSFTDDFIMGCYYSEMSPGYLTNLLFNEIYDVSDKTCYYNLDYDTSISYLKKFMISKSFDKTDIEYVLYMVKKEWDLLYRVKKKISLLLVKRCLIDNNNCSVDDYINDNNEIYEIIDRMLSSKNGNISFNGIIDNNNVNIITLDGFYDIDVENINKLSIEDVKISYLNNKELMNKEFLDAYGKVYIFLIIGSLFISLGVIITIIMIIRGI